MDAHDTCWGGFICVPCQCGAFLASADVVGTMRKDFFELFFRMEVGAAGGMAASGGGPDGSAEVLRIDSTMSSGVCAYTMHAKSIKP
jgi:hypothetical protein